MSRIRSIKPAVFRSTSVANLDKPARLTWIGLWTYLDDYGYGRDDPRLVKAEIWPLDDDYTAKKVETDLKAIATQGMICRFEAYGRRYMHAPAWLKHQRVNRPQLSLIPPCPHHGDDKHHQGPFTDDAVKPHNKSVNAHGGISDGIGIQEEGIGNRESTYVSQSSKPLNGTTACGKPDDDEALKSMWDQAEQLAVADLADYDRAQARKPDKLDPVVRREAWLAKVTANRYQELLDQHHGRPTPPPRRPDCPSPDCVNGWVFNDHDEVLRCPDCTQEART